MSPGNLLVSPTPSLLAPPNEYPDDHPGSQRSRKLCSVLAVAGVWMGGEGRGGEGRRKGRGRGGEGRGEEERGGEGKGGEGKGRG